MSRTGKNITEQRFGKLTAIRPTESRDKNGAVMWECRCDCGNTVFVSTKNLKSGFTKSCGCLKEALNLEGQRFGKLVVVEKTERYSQGNIVWKCRCDCGNITFVDGRHLKNGHSKSCGCLRSEKSKERAQDLTGQRFGRFTAIQPTERRQNGSVVWECRCDCGNTVFHRAAFLRSKAQSCGCIQEENRINRMRDVTGVKFGRLTGIKPTEKRSVNGSIIWEWQCDCGEVVEKELNEVSRGLVKSCGCLYKDSRDEIFSEALAQMNVLGTNLGMIRPDDVLKISKNNKTGVRGVFYLRSENVFIAGIGFQGIRVYRKYKTLEEATVSRRKMKQIHEGFLEWWDSLSDEEKSAACAEYKSEKATQIALLRKRMKEIL